MTREKQPAPANQPGKMPVKAKKFAFPVFWTVYAALLLLFVIALLVGAAKLKQYLTAFEASQPIHLAEEVFQQYFSGDSFLPALEKSGYAAGEFESLEEAEKILESMKEGKTLTFYATIQNEEEVGYNVVLVDESVSAEPAAEETGESEEGPIAVQGVPSTKIASFYLTKSAEEGAYGFRSYAFSRMEMFLKPEKSVKVTLPSTSRLTLNGKEVGADRVIGETAHEFNDFLPAGVPGITLQTYEITGLYADPTLAVTDANGKEERLDYDEETGTWNAALNYSEELKTQYAARILSGMKEYAKYIQDDGRMGLVSPYFDTASEFYRNISYNLSQFVWDHNGYEFRNEKVEDFYAFDDNTFCCHVSFDHVLHLYGREDYVDELDMIVFAKRKGNNFYIYDRIVQ